MRLVPPVLVNPNLIVVVVLVVMGAGGILAAGPEIGDAGAFGHQENQIGSSEAFVSREPSPGGSATEPVATPSPGGPTLGELAMRMYIANLYPESTIARLEFVTVGDIVEWTETTFGRPASDPLWVVTLHGSFGVPAPPEINPPPSSVLTLVLDAETGNELMRTYVDPYR